VLNFALLHCFWQLTKAHSSHSYIQVIKFSLYTTIFLVCPSHSVFARLAFCMPSAKIVMCLQTWADWKSIPIFYFLYDWLLGLLEDALSPVERPHSITITAAWQHMLCVAILGSGIFLVAASRLTWLLLVYCYKGETLDCTPSFAPGSLLCMWSSCLSLPKVLNTLCAQRGSRPVYTFNAGDVATGQRLCHVSLAACLHIMHVHGTRHYQPRARQLLAMSALQSLVQAVNLGILMAPPQPEICFHPCVSNNLLRTFLSYISPN